MRDNQFIYGVGEWFQQDFSQKMDDLGCEIRRKADFDDDMEQTIVDLENWLSIARRHLDAVKGELKNEAV